MTKLLITRELQAPGRGPAGLAWDGQNLWNADYPTGALYALNPDTGEQIDHFLCPGVLSGLAWDGAALWQVLLDEGWLRKINPKTHDYDHTIVVANAGRLAGAAWDGRRLWLVSQQRGRLLGIDRESEKIVAEIEVPVAAAGLAYRDDALWVGYPDRMATSGDEFRWVSDQQRFFVAEIDLITGVERQRFELDFLPLGLAWAGDALWLSNAGQRKLYQAHLP